MNIQMVQILLWGIIVFGGLYCTWIAYALYKAWQHKREIMKLDKEIQEIEYKRGKLRSSLSKLDKE